MRIANGIVAVSLVALIGAYCFNAYVSWKEARTPLIRATYSASGTPMGQMLSTSNVRMIVEEELKNSEGAVNTRAAMWFQGGDLRVSFPLRVTDPERLLRTIADRLDAAFGVGAKEVIAQQSLDEAFEFGCQGGVGRAGEELGPIILRDWHVYSRSGVRAFDVMTFVLLLGFLYWSVRASATRF